MKYLLLIFLPQIFLAQELHHQMISSQGNTHQLSSGMIVRATVGQSVTGNSVQKDYVVQQGFQQSYWARYLSQSEQNVKNTITVTTFPNPFVDFINFRFSAAVSSEVDVSIFDVAGRRVVFRKAKLINNQISIDLIRLPRAEYLARLSSGRFEYYVKIIKQSL